MINPNYCQQMRISHQFQQKMVIVGMVTAVLRSI